MASRLTREKDIPTALSAFKKVLHDNPKAGLIIVGSGPEEENIKNKIEKLGIKDNVIVEPWQNDLVSYYKTTDIFLSTSLYEGYGLTLIEAGISGAAIVSTDVGVVGDLLRNNEHILSSPVEDTNTIAKHLQLLINDGEQRLKLAQVAQQTLSLNLVSKTKQEYLSMYKKLMEKAY